ncbi:MAG: glycosyltransferase family 4 protein [Bacteroidaceae bacterium]|nr:glycosyltransferase family 4 protein [Bacteroidaceae bacterium]
MKIVLVGGQEVPGIGGAENYMLNLARELCVQGHSATIICSGRKPYQTTIDNVKIIHKTCPKSNIIALPLLFFKSIGYIVKNRKNIDIVNYQSIFLAFVPGWITTLCGCRAYYTIHSLAEDNPKHGAFMKWLMKLVAFISIWCCGKNIITISKSKAQEIKKRYGKKCTVIPCGISVNSNYSETDILDRFNIGKGKYYLTIGRVDPIKNLDVLIKAFIKHNNPDKQLVIAGNYENEHGNYLKELAKEHNNIIFTGIVMGNDKDTLLKNCFVDCLVSSSEGMPISLLEAMIYAKPCIVTDIPAIHEIMEEEYGYWCKVGDAETLCKQMECIEKDYSSAIDKGLYLKTNIENNYIWKTVTKRYISYITARQA